MDLGLAGRVAIIGGSSRGIGKATAMALAREGASVTLCARHRDELDEAGAEIAAQAAEDRVLIVEADLVQPEDIHRVVEATLYQWDRIDVLVNNAGGSLAGQPLGIVDKDWLQAFDVNFFSITRMCREVVPAMRDRGWGRIVN